MSAEHSRPLSSFLPPASSDDESQDGAHFDGSKRQCVRVTAETGIHHDKNTSTSWVKRVVPGNGNHGGRLILNLYSKYWPN